LRLRGRGGLRRAAVVALCLVLPAVAAPQDPSPAASLRGEIYDREGPVEGARVGVAAAGSPSVLSRADGSYLLARLPPGRWPIEVTAEGYLPSTGWVTVGRETRLDVELRRLDEGTPRFSENDPAVTVRRWLERAESLLEQGEPGAARAELEKTLPYLEGANRAEVLWSIARSHHLEGEEEKALERLWDALRADPESEIGRRLYLDVASGLGRREEAERRVRGLADLPSPSLPAAASPTERSVELPPPQQPEAHRPGGQVVHFPGAAAEEHFLEVRQRYGLVGGLEAGELYDPGEESYSLWVPPSYRRGEKHGLLVWISPTAFGGLRTEEVKTLLAERRLIWIGANGAGNPRPIWERLSLALDAAEALPHLFDIDTRRIWVGGYSGGGRSASALLLLFPEIFTGGLCWMGVDTFEDVPVPYKPGHSWAASFERPSRARWAQARKRPVVLVTGDLDFNRSETRAVAGALRDRGLERLLYLQVPEADHYFGLREPWIGTALAWLDGGAP
jgi:hypothetical protein